MQRWFNANFKTLADQSSFLRWLAGWEKDNKADTDPKIRLCQVPDLYSVVIIHCSDEHFDVLFNAVGGFNGWSE